MHLKHGAALQGGKYRIVKVLGAGSFGVTYLAKTKVIGNFGAIETSVAIKEFFSSELNTRLADGSVREMSGNSLASKYMKKFAEEADKISLLKEHPGIVKVLETFSENNTCYYVMEYKDGGSLREYVDGNGGVPESEAIEMIRKIGDALSYMHSRKMLHLDLKPGNVMMDSDGSLCLIDFGLSRHFENEESESTTGIGLGTVGYAPIEQAGYNSSDVRKDIPVTIDIYALGATFYKILTGKTPPPSYELLQSFPSAALEAKGVSAKTIEAIKKAMSPIPSFRPQTVAEFLLMLDKDYKPSVTSVAEDEKTEIFLDPEPSQDPETINEDSHEGDKTQVQHKEEKLQKKYDRWLWWLLAAVTLVGVGVFALVSGSGSDVDDRQIAAQKSELAELQLGFESCCAEAEGSLPETSVAVEDAGSDYEDLSNSGRANCYIVSENGSYKFPTVKGNSSDSVGDVKSVEVLWESFGTSTAPKVGDLIKSISFGSSYIIFQTADTFKKGNAVIAARNASGTILWSWHIWLTDQPGKCVYANNAGTMMDRNLGATSATPGKVGALGLLYQWGRKDPFLGSSSISSNVEAKSTISWPSAVSSSSSRGTIVYATEHPTTFITYNDANYDWYYSGTSLTDDTRWQSAKTVYDPCPAGWRVPDGVSNGVWDKAGFDDQHYDSSDEGMLFGSGISSPATWYPAAGYRYASDGAMDGVGNSGYYWSVTPYGSSAYSLIFYGSGSVYPTGSNNRARGLSVRCLQE